MCLLLSLPVFLLLGLVLLLLYLAVLLLPPLLTTSLFFIAILLGVFGAIAQSAWQLGKILWAYNKRQGWRKYVAIAAVLVGLTTIGWIVKQSGWLIERSRPNHPLHLNRTILST